MIRRRKLISILIVNNQIATKARSENNWCFRLKILHKTLQSEVLKILIFSCSRKITPTSHTHLWYKLKLNENKFKYHSMLTQRNHCTLTVKTDNLYDFLRILVMRRKMERKGLILRVVCSRWLGLLSRQSIVVGSIKTRVLFPTLLKSS